MTVRCPVCGSVDYDAFHRVSKIPVHVGVLWPTRESAQRCPTGTVWLHFCDTCGFIGNTTYQPDLVDYTLTYDNALHFSGVFQDFEKALAARLINRYQLHGKKVLEIGCGGGHFLGLLCELGAGHGIGFDPSHDPLKVDPQVGGCVEIVPDYFSERYSDTDADFICCRHVLEHIDDPVPFLSMIRRMLEPETTLYFEVPNARLILDRLSIWDIMYEHCDYFTAESLRYLFETCGFDIIDLYESYDDQFLGIEARASLERESGSDLSELRRLVSSFSSRFQKRLDDWQARMSVLREQDARVVAWGGGGKAVSFLNMFGIAEDIEFVVDVNPAKQGTFLAGSAHRIVAPEHLKRAEPHTVIVLNPVYTAEIRRSLHDMGLHPVMITAS